MIQISDAKLDDAGHTFIHRKSQYTSHAGITEKESEGDCMKNSKQD